MIKAVIILKIYIQTWTNRESKALKEKVIRWIIKDKDHILTKVMPIDPIQILTKMPVEPVQTLTEEIFILVVQNWISNITMLLVLILTKAILIRAMSIVVIQILKGEVPKMLIQIRF